MGKIVFTKMSGSGNDFIIAELNQRSGAELRKLAVASCDRKYGIGADGLLVLEKSRKADMRMRIFNSDGSEAEMCGNGARCTAFYLAHKDKGHKKRVLLLETRAGLLESSVEGTNVRIKLTDPCDLKINLPIKIEGRLLRVNFINTGVPHVVIFVEGLEKINVDYLGRKVRYHEAFVPHGTNVNFVEVKSNNSIKVRTYERGVEAETLACGTGSVASALISAYYFRPNTIGTMQVCTRDGEILKVYFERVAKGFKNIWLEGGVKLICEGVYYV